MNIEVFVLCDAATESLGKLNILGAFDTIFAQTIPTDHPQCAVALRLRLTRIERGKHKLAIHIVDEDGKQVLPPLEPEFNIAFPDTEQSSTINLILNIQRLRLDHFGEYAINLAIDGKQESSLPLFLRTPSPRPQ